jgi:outer membrane protein assembly complex protein YaeT
MHENITSSKKRWSKRKKRFLFGTIIVLTIFITGGLLALHTSKFQTYLLSKIDQRLRQDFSLSLTAKSLDLNIFRLSASFDELKIIPLTPEESILRSLSAQRLSINLSSKTLFGKKVHIQELYVTEPEIQLSKKKGMPPSMKKGRPPGKKSLSLRVDEFLLKKGKLDYQDKEYPIAASIDDIGLNIHFDEGNDIHKGILTMQSGKLEIFESQFSLDKLRTELTFDDQSIQITQFLCETEPFSATASGQIQNYQENPQYFFSIEGKLRLDFLNKISEIGHNFAGILSFATSLKGTGADISFEGHFQAKDIYAANIPLKNLEGGFQGDRTRIDLYDLKIEETNGSLKGQFALSLLEKGDSSAAFEWTSLRLRALENWIPELSLLSSTETSGSITAKWKERTLESIEATGEARLESSPKPIFTSDDNIDLEGNVKFQVKNGIITLFPSSMRLNQTTLAVSGSLSPSHRFNLMYQLRSKDLKDTERLLARLRGQTLRSGSKDFPPIHIDGQLLLSGEASGSFEQPEASLSVEGRSIQLNSHEIGNVDAKLTYSARTIDILSLSIEREQGGIQMDGNISIDPFEKSSIPSAELRLKASGMDISPFSSFFQEKYSIQGFLSGEATLSGKMSDPSIQFFLALNDFVVNNEDFSSIRIKGQYLKQKLTLEEFGITKSEGILEGSLGLDLRARTFDIDLEGRSIDLSTFRTINTEEKTFQGSAHLMLMGRGTIENPVFSFNLSMENISAQSVWVGFLTLKAVSDGRVVDIRMETPLGQTSVAAKLPLEEPYLLEGQINTESIDIWHAVRSGLEPLPSPIASQISATANFMIPLRDWTNATFSMNLRKGSFRYKDFTIQTPQPVLARIQNQELILEDFTIQGPQTEFTVSGSLPLTEKHAGNIQIRGSLDLRLLEALFSGTEASGVLDIDGRLSGSLIEPVLNASMEMKNGRYISPLLPIDFQNISFNSEIKENVFHLDHLFIGIGKGNVSASGTIFLSPLLVGKNLRDPATPIPDRNEIVVSVNELYLDPFAETLSEQLNAQIGGRVDGTLRFQGDFSSLSQLEMEGELKRLELSLDEFKMSNEEKILFAMRNGSFHLGKFRLSGGQSFLQAESELSLQPEGKIDAKVSASLDGALLSPLIEDAVLGGYLTIDLNLQGDLQNPVINGNGKISDGLFQMEEPPILITNLNGTLDFPNTETVTLSLEGIVNGGTTNIQGNIAHRSFSILSARFEAKSAGLQLNYPEGFQAISDGTLILEKKEKSWFLGGDIKINQSYYNADIYPGGQLINTLRKQRRALRSDIPPSLRSLNLDINLSTVDAFIIENNLADLELDAGIRVSGTVFDPRLSGFVRNRQTGQMVFGNHEYEVEQASLSFQDADPLEGILSITAHTQTYHQEEILKVTLTITGTITYLEFGLSSSPYRTEIELASILITGYGTERLREDAAGVIGDQLMLYFLSPFASPFTIFVKNFLRAEEVTIQPINIASEADPGARFTFRKGLIRALDLIYSIDISNTQNQTWVLDYNLNKNFAIQSFARDDGSYGGSFSHRFFLGSPGGGKNALLSSRYKQFTIKDIHFEGDLIFPENDLRRLARSLKKGSVFSYKDLRKTINALETFYKARDYINAVIKPLLLQDNADSITIILNISPHSPAVIVFEGDPLSKKLKREVIERWNGRLPDEMSAAHAKKQILRDLSGKGRLDARVSYIKTNPNGKSVYTFSTSRGPKYRIENFDIKGKSSLSPKAIKKAVSGIPKAKGKGLWVLVSDFKRAKLRIESFFAENGYQNAIISRPEILFDRAKNVIEITLPIDQGVQSRISSIQITGNSVFTDLDLKNVMRLKEERIFSPTDLSSDSNMLYSFYRSNGFHDVKIETQTISGPGEAAIDFLYTIEEGQIHTVSSIEVRGNQRTPEHVIRRELTFKEGGILRTRDLIASQKKLYDLMIFRNVNIRRLDIEGQRERPRVLVEVQENPRFAVSYGLRYNSEEKLEGFGQLDLINILGWGNNGLFFYRQNDRQKDYRFSLKDPYLFGKRFNTLYSFFYTEETISYFKEELWGLSIQQQLSVTRHSTFSYLFRINNIRNYTLDSDDPYPFDFTYFLPEFQVFWVRDTRTSLLNAINGSFLSLSLTYSPEFLNTTLKYISFFGQYSLFVPISDRVIWASNYRIGLADAFDQVLAPNSRRFFAGGANSVRGFERDKVGPYIPFLELPLGGEALFVMNQELRFPLYKWLEGVAFFDVGNVYENLGDINPLDVRTGAGFGLRLHLPAIFLRLDYGINLAPREYEKKTVIYFSIGQAF